jgi:hypothetical protein
MQTKSDDLLEYVQVAVKAGETPYRAAREAYMRFHKDAVPDFDEGIAQYRLVSDGIPEMIAAFTALGDACRTMARSIK